MNWAKLIFGLLLLIPSSWIKNSKLNAAIDVAAESFANAEYEQSLQNHLAIQEQFGIQSSELDFNLGLSAQYAEKLEEAAGFYDKASTSSNAMLASFAYNQGGVLLGNKKEYEVALSKFKSALIQDPLNEVARYNYELLARWLKRDEERKNQEENPPEPSEFAKRKKAEADRLVEQFRFRDALNVMTEALEQDSTVAAYQEFITHLQEVTEINEK